MHNHFTPRKLKSAQLCLTLIRRNEHQISKIEQFLKDRVKLMTGVMAAENSAFSSQKYSKLHFKIYLYCNNI